MLIFAEKDEKLLGKSLKAGTASPSSAIVGNLIFYWLSFFARAGSDSLSLIRLGETVPRQEKSSPALIHFENSRKSEAGKEDVQ